MSSMSNSGSGSDNLLLFISDKMYLKRYNKSRSPILHLKFLLISLHCMCTIHVMFHTNNMIIFTTDFPCSVSSLGHVPANCQGNGVLGWSESCTQRPCCKKLHVRLFHPGIICFMHGVSLVFSGHSQIYLTAVVVCPWLWKKKSERVRQRVALVTQSLKPFHLLKVSALKASCFELESDKMESDKMEPDKMEPG